MFDNPKGYLTHAFWESFRVLSEEDPLAGQVSFAGGLGIIAYGGNRKLAREREAWRHEYLEPCYSKHE
jgi:hypothetical protein